MSYWGFSPIQNSILDYEKRDMSRYQELEERLYDKRFKPYKLIPEKKVASNTHLLRVGEDISVRLYNTIILTFKPNGTVTINAAGWKTVTTRNRINDLIGPHLGVYSSGGTWHITARQVEKHDTVHWREEIQWTHTVSYEFYDGMSFDVETGLLVWNPYQWQPMEYVKGMLQAPVIARLDALEAAMEEALATADENMTNDFINEMVTRHEIVNEQFNTLRKEMSSEVSHIEWRMETTLERTMSLFGKRAEVDKHKRKAKAEGWCEECSEYGHKQMDDHQMSTDGTTVWMGAVATKQEVE